MERVSVVQSSTATLEAYVSGYPIPTPEQLVWYRPGGYEILESDEGVEFQNGHRRLILSNLYPHQAGMYVCTVTLMLGSRRSTRIQLDVYGKHYLIDGLVLEE